MRDVLCRSYCFVSLLSHSRKSYHVKMFPVATNMISRIKLTLFRFSKLFWYNFFLFYIWILVWCRKELASVDIVESKGAKSAHELDVSQSECWQTLTQADHNTWCRGSLEDQFTVLANTSGHALLVKIPLLDVEGESVFSPIVKIFFTIILDHSSLLSPPGTTAQTNDMNLYLLLFIFSCLRATALMSWSGNERTWVKVLWKAIESFTICLHLGPASWRHSH